MDLSSAEMELLLLNSEAANYEEIDVVTRLTNRGLSPEIVTRISELWHEVREIGGRVVSIGKIVVIQILEFVDENANFAIGAAIGGAVGSLIGSVPVLGPILTPLAITLGIFVGGALGGRIDDEKPLEAGALGMIQEVIIVARKFFELLISILNAVSSEYREA